jgi:6-pyruvoyltetrahydropterin/6-carboxytetrahydropterin synthase
MSANREIRITRRATFAAAHILCRDDWSDEKNREVFGACATDHGHNYVVEVTVRGPIDPETGMVINLTELKAIVNDAVVQRFDHADLNADALFRGRVPTTENIAIVIWGLLVPKLGAERLWQVRVREDDTLYVDYRGGDDA